MPISSGTTPRCARDGTWLPIFCVHVFEQERGGSSTFPATFAHLFPPLISLSLSLRAYTFVQMLTTIFGATSSSLALDSPTLLSLVWESCEAPL